MSTDVFNIPPFKEGGDIRETRPQLEMLRKAILALRPAPSGDIIARATADGVLLTLRNPRGSSSSAPFSLSLGSDGVGQMTPGTINGLLPDNWNDELSIGTGGVQYVYIDATASLGEIIEAPITVSSSPPGAMAPYNGEPPVSFAVLLWVVVDGMPFRIWGDGNIQAAGAEAYRFQKPTPVPGQVPYDIWYTWNLSVL